MKNKSLDTILYSVGGVILMLALLVALNVVTGAFKTRIDLTQDKAYTLSDGTRAILKKLDTPVKIRFYCSQTESATSETLYFKNYARRVEDVLNEFRQAGGKNVIIEKYDPQPSSDAEDSARLDGLEPQPLPGVDAFYLGLCVSLGDERQTMPFLMPNRERLLEYDLARAISRVFQTDKPVVGVMSALPVFGMAANPMMMQMTGQQGSDPWAFLTELRNDFDVRHIEMTAEKIDSDVKVLVVIHPKEISEQTQYAIDQFVLRGGKLIAFLDAFSVSDQSGRQGGMMARMGGSSSTMPKLLSAWGVQFDTTKVVADLRLALQTVGRNREPQSAPAYLGMTSDTISKDDITTSQIESIWLPLCGEISGTPAQGLKETVLLESTPESQMVDGMLANISSDTVIKEFKASNIKHKLAVRLTGKFKTAFPDGRPPEKKTDDADKKDETKAADKKEASLKESIMESAVVIVGDSDLLNDRFAIQQYDSPFGRIVNPMNGNLSLLQNMVEHMTGDNNLISIRSRANVSRPFTVVREMEAQANKRYQGEIQKQEEARRAVQQRINELQQKKDKSQRFILSDEQIKARDQYRKEEAEILKRIKQLEKDLRREINSLETRAKWWNILAMPLLVTAAGLGIALIKRKRTVAK
jgi:ABC-type uncharacterized transport system involved in gliding motility auxiliary subunit